MFHVSGDRHTGNIHTLIYLQVPGVPYSIYPFQDPLALGSYQLAKPIYLYISYSFYPLFPFLLFFGRSIEVEVEVEIDLIW